jgi:hypothetical protein
MNPKIKLFCQILIIIFILLISLAGNNSQAAPQADPGINQVYVTNVRDGSFVVSWTTNLASDGKVEWGTTGALGNTNTDSVASTFTHYVTVSGLSPSSVYYFQVVSDTATKDNGGVPFQVTTGPTLSIPTPGNTVRGYMYETGGTPAVPNAIVYMQLQDGNGSGTLTPSQWFSARTSGTGSWSFNLTDVRTDDFSAYYVFATGTDNLRIVGQGGDKGTKGADPSPWIIPIPVTSPFNQDIILNLGPTAVKMVNLSAHAQGNGVLIPTLVTAVAGLAALLWIMLRRGRGNPA